MATLPENTDAWIKPNVTFLEAGEAHRITRLDANAIHGVSSTGSSWIRTMEGFLAAVRRGEICQTTRRTPQRPPPPKRRLAHNAVTREGLSAIRDHPLVQLCGDDLGRVMARTLQALRRGEPGETPHLRVLSLVAQAGALARGLGPHIANFPRPSGRPLRHQSAAQDIQALLARLDAFLLGNGDLSLGELQQIQALVLQGVATIHDPEVGQSSPIGRPQERWPSVRAVHSRLAVQQRNIARGTYRLADAIREVAEIEVLHGKRIAAGWRSEDMALVRLGPDDAEDLRLCVESIERALHGTYGTDMTESEARGYRDARAAALWLARRMARASRQTEAPG